MIYELCSNDGESQTAGQEEKQQPARIRNTYVVAASTGSRNAGCCHADLSFHVHNRPAAHMNGVNATTGIRILSSHVGQLFLLHTDEQDEFVSFYLAGPNGAPSRLTSSATHQNILFDYVVTERLAQPSSQTGSGNSSWVCGRWGISCEVTIARTAGKNGADGRRR